MNINSPGEGPSKDILAARGELERKNFRKQNGREFSPEGLTESAKRDPVGQILLSLPDGRLGVDGYRALKERYPNGIIQAPFPDFSKLPRTLERIDPREQQILMIVSGGQTGVDQGALSIAEKFGIEICGIVPKDRTTALGRLDDSLPMIENHSSNVDDRTQHNFVGADGTLALFKGAEVDGTALTIVGPLNVGRPLFVAQLDEPVNSALITSFRTWLRENHIRCLNIGGPRHSYYDDKPHKGDIQQEAEIFLEKLLAGVNRREQFNFTCLKDLSFSDTLAKLRPYGLNT